MNWSYVLETNAEKFPDKEAIVYEDTEESPNSSTVRDGSSTTRRWPGSCVRRDGRAAQGRKNGSQPPVFQPWPPGLPKPHQGNPAERSQPALGGRYHLHTDPRFVYLAVILDAFSRKATQGMPYQDISIRGLP